MLKNREKMLNKPQKKYKKVKKSIKVKLILRAFWSKNWLLFDIIMFVAIIYYPLT